MPTVNIYTKDSAIQTDLILMTNDLKKFIAEKLTCGAIGLSPEEISVRIIWALGQGQGMIGDVEVEVNAHSYPDRVKSQDHICVAVKSFMQDKCPKCGNVKVWLLLVTLGHSF